jgi:hypothetical protein
MAHITTIISKRQVSDDAIAVTIRCCANAKTDSTVTIYGASTKTPAQINARIDKHHDDVAKKCAGMGNAKTLLDHAVQQSKTHTEIK